MSSSHNPSEPSSAASTPRSERHLPLPPHRWHNLFHNHDGGADEEEPAGRRVRLMCSFGGEILPRPHDHQLRYVGGETRIVAVPRSASFAALLSKLVKLSGSPCGDGMQVKYQLPHEDLDALISVTSDEDLEIMMEEYDRLAAMGGRAEARTPRLRLFLFPPGCGAGGFGSLHDGNESGSRRDRWFLDAFNSGGGVAAPLERGQSEVSSVVSEVPDYLFGLDSCYSDEREAKPSRRHVTPSDLPESPVRRVRTSPSEPATSEFPPVKAKPATPPPQTNLVEQPVQPPTITMAGYSASRSWQYVNEPVPIYYVPTSLPQQPAGPVPIPLHTSYGLQPGNHGPAPMVYPHLAQEFNANPTHAGPVYVGTLPGSRSGPVGPYSLPGGYNVPAVVDGACYGVGGQGVIVSANPTAGIPSSSGEELPRATWPCGENHGMHG